MNKALFFTPSITAFDSTGKIDTKANINIYDHLLSGGIDGIVLMGSTGEFYAMTEEQKTELIDLAVGHINHRIKVYVGTGCMKGTVPSALGRGTVSILGNFIRNRQLWNT